MMLGIKKQQAKQLEGMKKQREKGLTMWNLRSSIGHTETRRISLDAETLRLTGNPAKGRTSRRRTISGFLLTAFRPASTSEAGTELSLSVTSEPKAQTNEATTPSMLSSAPMDSISPLSIGSPLQTSGSLGQMARRGGDDESLVAENESDLHDLPDSRSYSYCLKPSVTVPQLGGRWSTLPVYRKQAPRGLQHLLSQSLPTRIFSEPVNLPACTARSSSEFCLIDGGKRTDMVAHVGELLPAFELIDDESSSQMAEKDSHIFSSDPEAVEMAPLSLLALALCLLLPFANAFTFTFGTPTQCDPLQVSWTGGTAPFFLTFIPVFGTPRNITIPPTAFSDGKGTVSFPVPLAQSANFIMTMSDSTGWNTGGTTKLLTVGASKGGNCNSTMPVVDFYFQSNDALQQCRGFSFSGYDRAVQPVTIYVMIPGGKSVVLSPPARSTSFTWTTNVPQGTSMLFFLVDARGRQGGSTDVRLVGTTNDNSCLNNQSPSSTANPPSASNTGTNTKTGGSPTKTGEPSTSDTPAAEDKKSGLSIAAIAGTVIGSLLFLAVLVTLGLFFLRKKRDEKAKKPFEPGFTYPSSPAGQQGQVRLQYEPSYTQEQPFGSPPRAPYPHTPNTGLSYDSNPFSDSTPAMYPPATSPYRGDASLPYSDRPTSQYSSQYQTPGYQPGAQLPEHGNTYPPQTHYYNQPPPHPDGPYTLSYTPEGPLPRRPADPFGTPAPSVHAMDEDPYASDAMMIQQPMAAPPPPPPAPVVASQPSSSSAAPQGKAALAGVVPYQPTRFIVHTDADDGSLPQQHGDDGGLVEELPPQYSESRAPAGYNHYASGSSKGRPPP